MRKHLKRKKRLTMKNVKSMIKPGMLINTANYVFATIIHPITGKLIAFPICGGPTLPIDESYDNDGNCVVWCNNCNSWQFAQLDVSTKDICISCHSCDGNFMFDDHIHYFETVGNRFI